MNKMIVTILLLTFLIIGGTFSILAEEEPAQENIPDNGLIEPQPTVPPANPCGGSEGNGGGGNPG